ncbi:peptide chain release factor N(5)-glutamine methyltransferase [[Clostridium] polysaccharolyticum]|uniref:Release factor glutamine methyltransferase n=1 Tax=[Clostridium] polysaccharolyticum TaxID=29364 RepID=A0A1H9Z7P7_9FIRM|nr:peptide chain release factor N(5)-glutamine methyltransferase [[Clostridium] polysaccharolyticum]SES76886.1 release factor glutamine methyltransferase [[Clostridium] polysaccharolyticum]
MATLEQLWTEGTEALEAAGVEEASLNAWYLLSEAFSITRASYLLSRGKEAGVEETGRYLGWIAVRATRYPLEYILGKQEFMGLSFKVNENVLIPRQDTEILVEGVLNSAKGKKVLDMCTGSGCIAISLAKLGNALEVHGVDISREALMVAKENADHNQVQVEFVESNLFGNVTGKYDIIVSNPPYIESKVIETLMPEVREFEPVLALDGTEDGLYFYREISNAAPEYLTEEGEIFFEIGYNQGEAVTNILKAAGFAYAQVRKDLAGLDRVVYGRLR